jgi:hypothetical protein
MITRNHLDWFRQKCPYPVESKDYKTAYRKLNGATYRDFEKLGAEIVTLWVVVEPDVTVTEKVFCLWQ